MCWLAGDDPVKIQALERMPLLEYLILLDKKIGDTKKLIEQNGRPTAKRNH